MRSLKYLVLVLVQQIHFQFRDSGWERVSRHSTDALVTKVVGNYNIVDNILNFVDPPVGPTPFGTSTNRPDERDWTGIATGSSFQGRIFLRSGVRPQMKLTIEIRFLMIFLLVSMAPKDCSLFSQNHLT